MIHSSQPTTSASQWYPSHVSQWQGYDFHQGGYGGVQMFPPPWIPGQGLSSPGAPRVHPGPPEHHPVNRPTSSSPDPLSEPPSGAPSRPPIGLPTKRFQPPAELRTTNVAGIVDLPPLPEITRDDYDSDDERGDSSDLGGAEGQLPICLKQTEFSLKHFAKWMGQANYSAFNKRKTVWAARFLEKKHQSMIRGQNCLYQVWPGPLHWEMAVADHLETFENWLPLDNSDIAEWIRWQWVEMLLKHCAGKILEARNKGWQGNKRPVPELGEGLGNMTRSHLPQWRKTMIMVVIRWVSIGKDMVLAPKQLQAMCTDVRQWEELIDFIDKNRGPKEPYILTSMFKCTMVPD